MYKLESHKSWVRQLTEHFVVCGRVGAWTKFREGERLENSACKARLRLVSENFDVGRRGGGGIG